jgi:hypothetical protein
MQALLRLCVHVRAGMISDMCAYSCSHDCAYLAHGLVGMKILRAQDKTKCDQLERLGSVYAHTFASIFMRHSDQLFGTKEDTTFGRQWQQTGSALQQPCFSTESKGTAMQKPGNIAKAFGLSRQVVHKH